MFQRLKIAIKKHGIHDFLQIADRKYGIGYIESIISKHWLNPFATAWINFRSLPIHQAIKFPIWAYGRPKIHCLSGSIIIKGKVHSGMFRFNLVKPGAPSFQNLNSEICNYGKIILHGSGHIGAGTKVFIESNAVLELGNDFKIMDFVNIGCLKSIKLGFRCSITHRCQLFDSNYHLVANFTNSIVPNDSNSLIIGNGCWIGNNSTILGKVNLPDYTIVASNSLVNKTSNGIPTNSIIGGIPAKLISTGFRRIYNNTFEKEIRQFYKENDFSMFTIPSNWTMDQCTSYDEEENEQ